MIPRRFEASRRIPIPSQPYPLDPAHLPFAFLFAHTKQAVPRAEESDDDEQSPPKPPKPEPTWSNPETTTPDSNDPSNDEEIDWLQDD